MEKFNVEGRIATGCDYRDGRAEQITYQDEFRTGQEEEFCRNELDQKRFAKEEQITIKDQRDKYCESAYIDDMHRDLERRRRVKYSAKNTIHRGARDHRRFIDYSAIDRYLSNEIVINRRKGQCDAQFV